MSRFLVECAVFLNSNCGNSMTSFFSEIPLVVSYYTKDTPYENEVKHLIESCEKFGIQYHIEGVPDRGSWEANCAIKPYFMRDKMKELQRPIMWVDADAVFLQPMQFEEFMFSSLSLLKYKESTDPRFSINAATVYVNATEGGVQALDLWCYYSDKIMEMASRAPAFMDQASLYFVLLSDPPFSIAQLPLAYCKIFDRELEGLSPDAIVIEQRQASKRFKKEVNSGC